MVAGVLSGSTTAGALMNLGKTITLPGSVASLSVVGRTWANAGVARTSVGATSRASRALFILNFMGVPFSLRPLAGDVSAQALCQLIYKNLVSFPVP